ncbi:MAG TPA: TPM domain-containing protein, partial [Steroidobacteraceae bacterium]|nr:TPM domain-containing protein [Steroidobacteraceae bacterium]
MIQALRPARVLAGVALLGLLGLGLNAAGQSLQAIPKLSARVTDLTGTLTAEQQNALEQKLAAFEAAKGAQLAVLIVPSTQPEEIEQYSIRVVEQWKLGRGTVNGKRVDDGALLIVAKDDHRIRIEVGYGLEGVLT